MSEWENGWMGKRKVPSKKWKVENVEF